MKTSIEGSKRWAVDGVDNSERHRVAHAAHSPYFGGALLAEAVLFSVIKWSCFR